MLPVFSQNQEEAQRNQNIRGVFHSKAQKLPQISLSFFLTIDNWSSLRMRNMRSRQNQKSPQISWGFPIRNSRLPKNLRRLFKTSYSVAWPRTRLIFCTKIIQAHHLTQIEELGILLGMMKTPSKIEQVISVNSILRREGILLYSK